MIFCQLCKKANPDEVDYCQECGTYLMVISRPYNAGGFEHGDSLEEHLLERISALESALTKSNERFEQLLDLAQQQATGSFYDHMMLEALTEILTEMHAVNPEELEQRWRNRVARHYEETAERERLDERCERIISAYRGAERDEFIDLVEEGTLLIAEGRRRRGLRMLEAALVLDEHNAELSFTIGEHYFQLGKQLEAAIFLRRALDEQCNHFGARLLLGLLSGDEGEPESAKLHLQRALELDDNSFAAHYGLGRLLAREGKLSEALTHLKRALSLNPTPEMHYLVGRTYWEQGSTDKALKHFQKAVRLDPRFDVAFYSLGLICWQSNRTAEAREHFRAAYEINPQDSDYRTAVEARAGDELPRLPAFGWSSLFPRRKAKVTETRFVELLWRDLNAFSISSAPSRKTIRK
ncbi:MAG: tetratricopeptide repeat protein [Acidobacteria bacterium]|nr:tetratricopeptide repeat protein [Acidobacteriota bacterium]